MVWAWRRTQASAARSPSLWKDQAAFHRYSRTWNEVHDDGHGDASSVGFGVYALDLVIVAVHECDPGAVVLGVAPVGLVEDRLDDGVRRRRRRWRAATCCALRTLTGGEGLSLREAVEWCDGLGQVSVREATRLRRVTTAAAEVEAGGEPNEEATPTTAPSSRDPLAAAAGSPVEQ